MITEEPTALAFSRQDIRAGRATPVIESLVSIIDNQARELTALKAPRVFTGAEINTSGWTCLACEPGNYHECWNCEALCDQQAQFVNRLIGGAP